MMLQRHRNKSLADNPEVEPAYKAGMFVPEPEPVVAVLEPVVEVKEKKATKKKTEE